MYDMLELKPFDTCSFGVCLIDSSINKPLGRIDDVLIVVNDNYVNVDFLVMEIDLMSNYFGMDFSSHRWCYH